MDTSHRSLVAASIVLGVSFLVGVGIVSFFVYQARYASDTMVVTGSAKERVQADMVKWTSQFSRTVSPRDLKAGFGQMQSDRMIVAAFMKQNGLSEADYTLSSVSVTEPFKYDANAPRQYVLAQTVTVNSPDVAKITALAKDTGAIINQGVVFTTLGLEYYYSKLPDLRLGLVSKAIQDAQLRAQAMAQQSNRKLGAVKSVSQGVTQVLAPNSIDVSDYGTYDTSTVDKDVMMTVRLVIGLQ